MNTNSSLTLMKFWAPWCRPCLSMKPVIDRALLDYNNINLVSINVDEDVDTVREYGIRSIPTLLLIKDDKVVDKLIGAAGTEQVEELLSKA